MSFWYKVRFDLPKLLPKVIVLDASNVSSKKCSKIVFVCWGAKQRRWCGSESVLFPLSRVPFFALFRIVSRQFPAAAKWSTTVALCTLHPIHVSPSQTHKKINWSHDSYILWPLSAAKSKENDRLIIITVNYSIDLRLQSLQLCKSTFLLAKTSIFVVTVRITARYSLWEKMGPRGHKRK